MNKKAYWTLFKFVAANVVLILITAVLLYEGAYLKALGIAAAINLLLSATEIKDK